MADSALGRRIAGTPAGECWVSPLSHAILRDEFFTATKDSVAVARIGYAAVVANTRQMMRRPANYPYPDGDALEIWGQIRSADITIPGYKDGAAFHPEHVVGPDETLVYACAAANMKKLIGPAPVQSGSSVDASEVWY